MRDDLARVVDIWLACRDIQGFVRGVETARYLQDRQLQMALCMSLGIIGEAASSVSQEFQKLHPEIPWPQMKGLRNRIIHQYFQLDLGILWQIATIDVPALLKKLEPLIPPGGPQ
jgi:uncharacterized protein with HEPN domain